MRKQRLRELELKSGKTRIRAQVFLSLQPMFAASSICGTPPPPPPTGLVTWFPLSSFLTEGWRSWGGSLEIKLLSCASQLWYPSVNPLGNLPTFRISLASPPDHGQYPHLLWSQFSFQSGSLKSHLLQSETKEKSYHVRKKERKKGRKEGREEGRKKKRKTQTAKQNNSKKSVWKLYSKF